MVRDEAPSTAREVDFTKSRKLVKSSRLDGSPSSFSPFQAPLIASHSSMVKAVRTERALVRALVMQALIEVELSLPKARYSRTDFSDGMRPEASKAPLTPEEAMAPAQAVTAA